MTTWPKHPDGRPKKLGEMTRTEQDAQIKDSCTRLQREFNDPMVKEKIAAVLNGANVRN